MFVCQTPLHTSVAACIPTTGLSGERLNILGSTEIKVNGLGKPVTVRVIKGLTEQLIFGCDLLNGTIIDLVRGFVQIEGKQWPIRRHSPPHKKVCTILPDTGNRKINLLLRHSADVFSTPNVNLERCIHPQCQLSLLDHLFVSRHIGHHC